MQVNLPDENSLGGGKPCFYEEWDWKAQPNWDKINEFVQETGLPPFFHPVNTNTDQYAVLIGFKKMEQSEIEHICGLMGHKAAS